LDRSLYSTSHVPVHADAAAVTKQNLARTADVSIAKAETRRATSFFPLIGRRAAPHGLTGKLLLKASKTAADFRRTRQAAKPSLAQPESLRA
jgi:hypothetical protein